MPVDFSIELRLAYLRAAAAAQEEVEDNIKTYRDFYEGDHGVKLTDRQKEYLSQDVDSFGNVCKRVVGIPKERLAIDETGVVAFNAESEIYAETATDWWLDNNLGSKQKDVYEASLRDGLAALIVGYDERKLRPTFTPNLLYDGETGLVRFHYDSDDNLMFASKRWTVWNPLVPGETGKRRLTIYRADVIERYEHDPRTPGGWRFLTPAELGGPNPQIWTEDGTASGDPIGIPVIPFDNPTGSELADVINIQELLNHNLGTFDVSIDYHGFPLLYFTGLDLPVSATTGKAQMPDFSPAQAIRLREGGTAGRIDPADLKNLFEMGVLSWIQLLAIIKGWPLHLFERSGQPPSGIALKVLEGSLIAQVEDKQDVFGESWRQAFDVGRKLHRLRTGEDLAGDLLFNWHPAEISDELTHVETLAKKFEAGEIPVIQRWRELGYTREQIDQMLKDRQQVDPEREQRLELGAIALERERAMINGQEGIDA